MKLTEKQIDIIQKTVSSHGVLHNSLQADIVDHICCVLENQSDKNQVSFEDGLQKTIDDLAPHGLQELENKTLFLLNHKRIKIMKQITYIFGLFSSATLTLGVLFSIMKWPGAYKLFSIGFLSLCLIFIPFVAFKSYKLTLGKAKSERIKLLFGTSAAVLAGLGGLFKILHLQGANVLLLMGAAVFAFGFLPLLFFRMYKKDVAV